MYYALLLVSYSCPHADPNPTDPDRDLIPTPDPTPDPDLDPDLKPALTLALTLPLILTLPLPLILLLLLTLTLTCDPNSLEGKASMTKSSPYAELGLCVRECVCVCVRA